MNSKYLPVSTPFPKKIPYAESDGSDCTLLNEELEVRHDESSSWRRFSQSRWLVFAHVVLLVTSMTFCVRGFLYSRATTRQYVEEFSTYSPASVAVEYRDVLFNGSMYLDSPYTGSSAAVDDAWASISYNVGDQIISKSELSKINKPPTVMTVTDPATGTTGYRARLEVFHQLHCLNLLRKMSFRDHYTTMGDKAFAHGEEKLRTHTNHCIDTLRQTLMCQADIGLVTFHHVDGAEKPKADFNTWHTCRNFDRVLEWAMENTVVGV